MLANVARGAVRIVPTLPTLSLMLSEQERQERLAYWIGDIRRQRGLTPPKLARLVGVVRSTVNKWESGDQVPSLIWLGPLSKALGVDARLFADLPPIPPRGGVDYLVDVVEEAMEEGIGADLPDDEEPPSRARRPRKPRPKGGS